MDKAWMRQGLGPGGDQDQEMDKVGIRMGKPRKVITVAHICFVYYCGIIRYSGCSFATTFPFVSWSINSRPHCAPEAHGKQIQKQHVPSNSENT